MSLYHFCVISQAHYSGLAVRWGRKYAVRVPPRGFAHAFGGSIPAPLDAEDTLLKRITVNPAIFGGKPILRGHRLVVEHVPAMLAAGDTPETIRAGYPWMEAEDIRARPDPLGSEQRCQCVMSSVRVADAAGGESGHRA